MGLGGNRRKERLEIGAIMVEGLGPILRAKQEPTWVVRVQALPDRDPLLVEDAVVEFHDARIEKLDGERR